MTPAHALAARENAPRTRALAAPECSNRRGPAQKATVVVARDVRRGNSVTKMGNLTNAGGVTVLYAVRHVLLPADVTFPIALPRALSEPVPVPCGRQNARCSRVLRQDWRNARHPRVRLTRRALRPLPML